MRASLLLPGVSAAALAGALLPAPLRAQAEAPALDPQPEIVVTGSRIRRPDFRAPNPVVSLDADAIQASGETNLTDFLVDHPALVGSAVSGDNAGDLAGLGLTGLNLLDLRNLGTDRTLVLIDGRRHVASQAGSQAVDVNIIPTELVERVEILTGGASAVYGADGVTGVVNFIMKKDFEGIAARGQGGISEQGDAGRRFASLVGGVNFGDRRGNLTLAYEYSAEDRLTTEDRAYLSGERAIGFYLNPGDGDRGGRHDGIPDQRPLRGVRFLDSAAAGAIDVDGDFFPDFLGTGAPFVPGRFIPDFYAIGGSGTLVADYGSDLLPEIERHIVSARGHYEASGALTLFAEAKYATVDSFTLQSPTFDFFLNVEPDNPLLPDAIRRASEAANLEPFCTDFGGCPILLNRDNFDLGPRGERAARETVRTVIGARGDVTGDVGYELSYVFGRTEIETEALNDIIDDRFYAAIDAVRDPATGQITCRANLDPDWRPNQPFVSFFSDPPIRDVRRRLTFAPGECVPLDLFGAGRASPAALDFIRTASRDRAALEQHVVTAVLSGDLGERLALPGGPIGFALGAEYRKEKSRFRPDALARGGLTFLNAVEPTRASFDVKEVFAELRAPLLENRPWAYRLELGGALRFSDYSTIGSTTTWKVDGAWAPVRGFRLAGTYSVAVRAPNITELYDAGGDTFEPITDPCNFNRLQNGSAARAGNCAELLSGLGVANPAEFLDERASGIRGFLGGNPRLSEETATTWTAGVVLEPRILPGLSLRADWYDIELRDAINYVEPQEAAELCVDQPTLDNVFCGLIRRQSGGVNPGRITSFRIVPQNVARFATAGLDLNLAWRIPAGRYGRFDLSLAANYLDKLEFIGTPGAPVTDQRGEVGAPEYQATLDLGWRKGPVTLNYGLSWFDETLRFSNQETRNNPDIVAPGYLRHKERWVHDLYAAVDVGDDFQFYGGVNNFTDERPGLGASAYPVSAVGRFFFAGARVRLQSR